MAAISSGVARPAVSSITETRYCISDHLLWFGAPLVGGRSTLLRRPLPRSDTASGCLSRLSVLRLRTIRLVEAIAGRLHRPSARWRLSYGCGADLPIAGLRPLGRELERHLEVGGSMFQMPARYFSLPRRAGL